MLLLVFGFSGQLSAQQQDPNKQKDFFEMSLEQLMEVEITSSARRPQPLARATSAMYVITEEDIRQAGPVRIEELLRQVPGMSVFRAKGLGYDVGSRGYTKWNNGRMQILLDGRPLYDPFFGGTQLYLNPVFLDEIERIEVIRGSAGVTWGVNAMNGVINIITKKAADTQGGLVYGSIGTQQLQQGFIRYGGTNGPLAWRATAGNFHEDGFANEHEWDYDLGSASGPRINDDYEAFQTTGRADLRLSEDTTLSFTGGYQNASKCSSFDNESLDYGNLLWKKTFKDDSSLQVRWTESEIFCTENWLGVDTHSREEMLEVQHNFVHDRHAIVWGADYTRDAYDSTPHEGKAVTVPEDFANDQGSAFIEDEITLANNLWFTLGYRAQYNELTNFDWAGRTALVWEFTPKHFLRGAISKSFRRPTFWEEFVYNTWPDNKYGNDSLRNEEMISYEIGYRGQWAKNLSVNIEGYVNKDKDIIALSPNSEATNWYKIFHNTYDATTYGIETSVEWRPFDWWLVRGFHTYMHQTNRKEFINGSSGELKGAKDEIMLSPQQQTGLTNCIYLDKSTTLNTQLYWNNGGATTALWGQEETKPFWKLDVRLAKRFWNDTAEIAIGAMNLLAPSHREGGYDDWWPSGAIPTEVPRLFYLQFFYKF
jgi:iron complex outermembrane receptor protein